MAKRVLQLWHEDRQCAHCGADFRPTRESVLQGRGVCCGVACGARRANALRYKDGKRSIVDRFNGLVERRGDDECWGWKGFKHKGYGRMGNVFAHEAIGAHRVSYILHVGPITDGLTVLHTCDNPECTNPKHLRLGTNTDNNIDRDSKGRMALGEQNGRSKLRIDQARDIKRRLTEGEGVSAIAKAHNVSPGCISQIKRGRTWAHC